MSNWRGELHSLQSGNRENSFTSVAKVGERWWESGPRWRWWWTGQGMSQWYLVIKTE